MAYRFFSLMVCALSLLVLVDWPILAAWRKWTPRLSPAQKCILHHQDEIIQGQETHLGGEPWSEIEPTRQLMYQPCFNGFNCTRLDLPMDWNSTQADEPRIQLAIAKLPAKVPVTDARYGGLIWLQSGGPGESGVDFLLKYGKSIQMIVDSDLDDFRISPSSNNSKFFEIMGIDSRGLNNSTPCFSCFPTLESREIWTLKSSAEGILESSDTSFSNLWARFQALGGSCSSKASMGVKDGEKLASHVNTAVQIADMTAILELHGQWREQEAWRTISAEPTAFSDSEVTRIIEQTKWQEGEEKLQYWGFSYGTIIGATFATMQPHRVERVVLDGVVNTLDYYLGERVTNLQDTDALLERIFEYCSRVGPESCALHTNGGAQGILQRFEKILSSLKKTPVGVISSEGLAPHLITYSDVLRAVFGALYAPIQDLPNLAKQLVDLSNGNGTSFATARKQYLELQATNPERRQGINTAPYSSQDCHIQRQSRGDTRMAILCSDSNSTVGMTREDFGKFVETLREQSKFFGPFYAQFRMMCIAWSLKASWRFPGPFAGKTAYPMLVVGNTLDPVTPIRNAHVLSGLFDRSIVLANDGEGHSSLSAPSLCMAHHIRQYFQQGELPTRDTECESNEKPFLGLTSRGDAKNARLLEELMWIARHWN